MVRRLTVLLSIIFLFSGVALAAEFSADTIMTSKGHTNTGKAFFGKNRFRIDMLSPQNMTVITRIDKKVIWNIMQNKKMYMEMPYDAMKNKPMLEEKMEGDVERKQVGTETIDGHPTKKYLVTRKSGGMQHQVYSWWATDINFPIKTAAIDGSWTQEYKNIKFGAQSDSLFEVPAGYTKFQMPSGTNSNINRP